MIKVERKDLKKLVQMAEMYSVHRYIEGSEELEEDALIKKMRFLLKDLQSVSEESLLKEIDCRVELLLQALRNYLAYKIFSAEGSVTCRELATETNGIHKLLNALNTYEENKND